MDKNNFWNNHTLNNFQQLAILKNVHSFKISSLCFLKDGRIASSSGDNNLFIYSKITFKIEIRIREKLRIFYMNITKDGILITCLNATYLNLYEIKGKTYSIIQTIIPYTFFHNIIGKMTDLFIIQKFIELKNGDIVFLLWQYALCFYRKKENSKEYSYINKFKQKFNENITDLCELDDKQYCLSFKYEHLIKFLDWDKKKIISTIKIDELFAFTYSANQLHLINKKDLFLIGESKITIIDTKKKEIIKKIELDISGYLSCVYKLSDNILLAGFWNKYIAQFEYDENKKNLKLISNIGKKYSHSNSPLFSVTSISIFNNSLIVYSYDNDDRNSSLIIHQLKRK